MPTNLTDRLGELIGCAESGAASDRSQLAHFVLNHKDEILALRKAEEADTAIERLTAEVTRLREQLAKDATRFEVCAGMIKNSHKASGTLRAERTIKARHFAGEALDTLRARLSLGDEK